VRNKFTTQTFSALIITVQTQPHCVATFPQGHHNCSIYHTAGYQSVSCTTTHRLTKRFHTASFKSATTKILLHRCRITAVCGMSQGPSVARLHAIKFILPDPHNYNFSNACYSSIQFFLTYSFYHYRKFLAVYITRYFAGVHHTVKYSPHNSSSSGWEQSV
jgi:hypothetical protein